MVDTDRERFATMMAGMYSFYPKAQGELSEFVLGVWWEAMKAYDYEAVADATTRHLRDPDEGKFLPKPGAIEKLLAGSKLDRATLAWTKVQNGCHHVGTYESVCFDDPIINAVLADMGGWIAHGQILADELPFKQREFEQRYRAYLTRNSFGTYPRCLPGIISRDNNALGYQSAVPPVQLIGDPAKAKAVYEGGGDGLHLTVTPLPALPAPTGPAAAR